MRIGTVCRAAFIGVGLAAAAFVSNPASAAAKYKVLYNFCSVGNCTDGGDPNVGLTGDGNGNFYGITLIGGGSGTGSNGTIFRLAKTGNTYSYQVLYTINCNQSSGNCPDGYNPGGELVLDTAGNLYGTMAFGGASNAGTLFELTTDGQFHVLLNFCSADNCTDGNEPFSTLSYVGANTGALYDGVSPLFATAASGGKWGGGLAFSFTPGSGEQSLFSFCHYSDHDTCSTGRGPVGAVAVDNSGTVYGANLKDAAEAPGGLLWGLGAKKVLHHFCDADPCKDGNDPNWGVFLDPGSSTLFGATLTGAANGNGVAYRLDTTGKNYSLLHTFCKAGPPCKDGANPSSTLYPDGAGGIIGTAYTQGANGQGGTVYRIDLATKKLSTLYSFCAETYCTDGASPNGRVVQSGSSIFGVTRGGGPTSSPSGVIYKLTP